MNNENELNEIGKKVFEGLKKQAERLEKDKKTHSYVSSRKFINSVLTDEEPYVLQHDSILQGNFKKMSDKLRSGNIKTGEEIIQRKKDE